MVCWANMRLVLVTFIRLYFIISSTLFIIYVYMFGLTGQAEVSTAFLYLKTFKSNPDKYSLLN